MKEFVEAINTRAKSPVFGYFVIAFFSWNWQAILFVVVSNASPLVRIEYFEKNVTILSTLVYPTIFSFFMGLFYPWLNLLFIKLESFPARIRNSIYAETEHSHLLRRLQLQRIRGDIRAEKENQLIDETKRDEEIEQIGDALLRNNLKKKISSLRRKEPETNNLELGDAAALALEGVNIEADEISTTGGKTGVRIWVSKEIADNLLKFLHEEIIRLHGRPVGLDVRNYADNRSFYSMERPRDSKS